MNLRFYIDPETGEPHIYRHGVSEREVEEVMRWPDDDFPGKGSRIALGQTDSGRRLQVIYVVEENVSPGRPPAVRPFTAEHKRKNR